MKKKPKQRAGAEGEEGDHMETVRGGARTKGRGHPEGEGDGKKYP